MKYVITNNDSLKLKSGLYKKYNVLVKGGCGQRGEGEFGGEGGYGQIKKFCLDGSKDYDIMIEFIEAASCGKSSSPINYLGELYHRGYKGGKPGLDVICTVSSNNESKIVKSLGGGGGGAGSVNDYVNYDPEVEHNLRLTSSACSGGANSDGILKYKSGTKFGGRGQDGDSDSSYDTYTGTFESEYGYNKGQAEVIIEGLNI